MITAAAVQDLSSKLLARRGSFVLGSFLFIGLFRDVIEEDYLR